MAGRAFTILFFCAACQAPALGPPPLTRFHFPSGVAVDVPYQLGATARAQTLYVVGDSNFDLAYSRGIVYAIDLDRVGDPVSGLVPPEVASGGNWDGVPQAIPDVADAGDFDPQLGYVYTDSLGGELRLAQTSQGTGRLFLATRFGNRVTAIDVVGPGQLGCYQSTGPDCLNGNSSFPLEVESSPGANQILDVFGISNPVQLGPDAGAERDIFITHLRNQSLTSADISTSNSSYYSNNQNRTGESYVIRENVDDPGCMLAESIGTYTADGVAAEVLGDNLIATFTGRFAGVTTSVRVLTLQGGGCQSIGSNGQLAVDATPDLTNIDLSSITQGVDGRGIAFSTSGDRVFSISRTPDALVVLRDTFAVPDQLDLHPSAVIPLPPGPTELLPLPRLGPDGTRVGDLVAISCSDSGLLVFYDDELGQVVASLPGVGDEPFGLAAVARTQGLGAAAKILPGLRIFVTAFGSGQVAVVDVPDPLNPLTAQVVALIGTREDTTVNPVNPSSTIFSLPYGYGSSGVP